MTVDVIITGGAGYIGSHLTARLLGRGRRVRLVELPGTPVDHLPAGPLQIVRGDIRHPADVRRAFAQADAPIVLHLAANPNLWTGDADEFEAINHRGTRNVLDEARRAGARRIVHVSSESILARPDRAEVINETTRATFAEAIGPYCRSKWRAEQAAWEAIDAGGPVTIVSPTVPVGPGDRAMGPLTRLIRDFAQGRIRAQLPGDLALVDVRDAAAGIWAAVERGRVGQRYLLAGENWTTGRLFAELATIFDRPAPRWSVPYPLALAFAHAEQWYCRNFNHRVPMATVTGVRLTRRSMWFDAAASQSELRLQPRPIDRAPRVTAPWMIDRGMIEAPETVKS